MINIVRRTGTEIHWDEIFEEESLKDFARKRNERFKEASPFGNQPIPNLAPYWFDPVRKRVEEKDQDFRLIGTYHGCATNPFRLL